jgi:hypothetical protein
LPTSFCRYGELRFVKELKNLPKEIAKQVFESWMNKYENKLIEEMASYDILDCLIKYFDYDLTEENKIRMEKYKMREEKIKNWLE